MVKILASRADYVLRDRNRWVEMSGLDWPSATRRAIFRSVAIRLFQPETGCRRVLRVPRRMLRLRSRLSAA